jgi:hypothetical protein
MRPVSFAVLAVAALLTSPALGAAATGDLPVDVALTRYLLAAGLCWLVLSVASEWLWPEPAPATQSPSQPSPSPSQPSSPSTSSSGADGATASAPEPGPSIDPVPAPDAA